MADLERIKRDIAEMANRPNGVSFDEIERIVNQLSAVGYATQSKKGKESHLFRINKTRFTVCPHNPKRKHLKAVYVKNFLKAMIELELFTEE